MTGEEQKVLLDEIIAREREKGKFITLPEAARKLHREHITRQLAERGWSPSGFLVVAGLREEYLDDDGFPVAKKNLLNLFNRYLVCENKLSGLTGRLLRDAMDRMGIDYMNSPTFPLEPLSDRAA